MKRVPILMYHSIADVPDHRNSMPPDVFKHQMELLWRAGYKTVSVIQLVDTINRGFDLPDKPVVITFDDGYEDNFTHAMPIMSAFDFHGTVFPIANWVGMMNDFEDKPNNPRCRMMDWDQLHMWLADGMELGSHTCSHADLTHIGLSELEDELYISREIIQQHLGFSPETLCYPYGRHNRLVRRTAAEAGYRGALAIFDGVKFAGMNPYALPRIQITAKDVGMGFLRKIGPLHSWLTLGRSLERRLKMRW